MKIGIILGSVREGRVGDSVAEWVKAAGAQRQADYEIIDLASFDLPVFDGAKAPMALGKQYDDERVTAWSKAVDACDGFIFVTPEYNHSVPGAFKNAVDHLGPEWSRKAIGFVGYSFGGAIRAVEHWRTIMVNFEMVDVRAQVALNLASDFNENGFAPAERQLSDLTTVMDQLEAAVSRQG